MSKTSDITNHADLAKITAGGVEVLKKFIKALGFLAADGCPKDLATRIETDDQFALHFQHFSAVEVEILDSLMQKEKHDADFGVVSVLEKYAKSKESVVISDAETCERDRETLTEFKVESKQLKEKLLLLEGQRADLQTKVENVHSLPGLAKDRARIEDAEKRLRRLEEIYEEKMEHASQKHRDQIAKVNKELERQVGLFEQECKHVLNQEKNMKTNEVRLEESTTEFDTVRDYVAGFRVIGCGGDESDHYCALAANHDTLNLDTVRKLFKSGIEDGLPEEDDALSYLFSKTSKLMTRVSMKKIFLFFKNIGLDRNPSFPGFPDQRIKTARIKSTSFAGDEVRNIETNGRMKLRLIETIFRDEYLPAIGHTMRNELAEAEENELAEAEEDAAMLRAEEQENEGKRPELPNSTKKRSLSEISPYVGNLVAQADQVCDTVHSAKRGRTSMERIVSSPLVAKTNFVFRTPNKDDSLDTHSISSRLSGTGFSKGDF